MADCIADDNDFMEVEIDVFEEAEIHIQNILREREGGRGGGRERERGGRE